MIGVPGAAVQEEIRQGQEHVQILHRKMVDGIVMAQILNRKYAVMQMVNGKDHQLLVQVQHALIRHVIAIRRQAHVLMMIHVIHQRQLLHVCLSYSEFVLIVEQAHLMLNMNAKK